MKKILLFWAIVLVFGTIRAQIIDTIYYGDNSPWVYEHRYPLDTVRYDYPMYMFNEPQNFITPGYPIAPVSCHNLPDDYFVMNLRFGLLEEYGGNGNNPKKLYGIATTVLRPYPEFFTGSLPYFIVASRDNAGEFVIHDSIPFDSYRVDKVIDYLFQPDSVHYYFMLHEYYFDHPFSLSDDSNLFYIGAIRDSSVVLGSIESEDPYRITSNYVAYTNCATNHHLNSFFWSKYFSHEEDWKNDDYDGWGVFFPIVRPDSLLCGKMENFRLEERGDDYAVVAWHPSRPFEELYSGHFQVALGGLGPRPDTTNILTFNDTTATLAGLDSGVWYSAWVRGKCDHTGCPMHGDTLIWSAWQGPLQFYLGSQQPGTQGIAASQAADNALTVVPNPAKGSITVALKGAGIQASLILLDASGAEVMRIDGASLPLSLDTSPLASGIYILRLTTPTATFTRKLIVAEK